MNDARFRALPFGTVAEKMETYDLVVYPQKLTDAGYAQKYPGFIDLGAIAILQDAPIIAFDHIKEILS